MLEKKRNESESLAPEESSVNENSDVGCSAGQIDDDQHSSRDCLIQVEDEFEEVFFLYCFLSICYDFKSRLLTMAFKCQTSTLLD